VIAVRRRHSPQRARVQIGKNAGVRAPSRRRVARVTLAVALVAFACSGAAASAQAPATPCGGATIATISSVVAEVADDIYRGELAGGEVNTDTKHVVSSLPLLDAVAADNRSAARRAVHALVYHRLWHIVRLRVFDAQGKLLADVGGPYVIAPLTGSLTLGGQVVGSYVMSVQDDYGYTLLETHAVGDPIAVYYHGKDVAWKGGTFPAAAPTGSTYTTAGITYNVLTKTYAAFPTGTLEAVILVPPPAPSLDALPCLVVRADEIGRVAEMLSARFNPLDASYVNFVEVVHVDTGATVLLRIGPRAIPGSMGLGPLTIPNSGEIAYLGHEWWVFSFAPTPPARIYLLIPIPDGPASGT
jgi:hypothetical protein